jgi:hypothetical protein
MAHQCKLPAQGRDGAQIGCNTCGANYRWDGARWVRQ